MVAVHLRIEDLVDQMAESQNRLENALAKISSDGQPMGWAYQRAEFWSRVMRSQATALLAFMEYQRMEK